MGRPIKNCDRKVFIVSINKPHVRPIKRAKAGADVEFGAKVSASVVDGFVFVDRLDWDNFNELTKNWPTKMKSIVLP